MNAMLQFPPIMKKQFFGSLVCLGFWAIVHAQPVFDAGFESGTTAAWLTYTGQINSDGSLEINTPGPDTSRHRVMHISEGFDPIAEMECDTNKTLRVVPVGGGQYALRLGNSKSGSQAERVVLKFTVTPGLTFFLLRYAVILQDPDHDFFQQAEV